ncbi:MAG: HPF/RaiA family ribosome-associated protein [Pseudomonadota bacterium]
MSKIFQSFQMSYVFRHMKRSEALEEVAYSKLCHSFGHLPKPPISCKVTFSINGDQHLVQASIVTGKGPDLYCHAASRNMYEAIDQLNSKILQQLEKNKYEPQRKGRQPLEGSSSAAAESEDNFQSIESKNTL